MAYMKQIFIFVCCFTLFTGTAHADVADKQPSALSPQPSTLSPQPSALSTQHSVLSTQHSALNSQNIQDAAFKGNAQAQNDLGGLFEKGIGRRKDFVEAVKWYRLAAEQGKYRETLL